MQHRFDSLFTETLIDSGWFSGRRVISLVNNWKDELEKSDSLYMFPKAEEVLLEFGGLKFNPQNLKGKYFSHLIETNPSLCACEGDRFDYFSEYLGMKIYPLGEQHFAGRFFLGISEDGRVFEIMQNLLFVGKDIDEALNNLILGVDSKLII